MRSFNERASPRTMSPANSSDRLWRRRDLIKALGATAIAAPIIVRGTTTRGATSKAIKIGHVTPQTGPLAPFAAADPFILDQIRNAVSKGINNGGSTYQVEIISKDSQSKTNRASEVAPEHFFTHQTDLIVSSLP